MSEQHVYVVNRISTAGFVWIGAFDSLAKARGALGSDREPRQLLPLETAEVGGGAITHFIVQ